MQTYFSYQLTLEYPLFFEGLKINNSRDFAIASICTFILAIIMEITSRRGARWTKICTKSCNFKSLKVFAMSLNTTLVTLFSLLIMLPVMTGNVILSLCVLMGRTFGYFLTPHLFTTSNKVN